MELITELRRVVELGGDTYSSAEVIGLLKRAVNEMERLSMIAFEAEEDALLLRREVHRLELKE